MANNQQGSNTNNSSGRGFASMDEDRQREIASQGGRAAHASGNAHEFTSEEARQAGAKSHGGGNASSSSSNASSRSGSNPSVTASGSGTRGGTPEQHAAAGRQSHKNDGR